MMRLDDFTTGNVSTIGKFQEFKTLVLAQKAYGNAILKPELRDL